MTVIHSIFRFRKTSLSIILVITYGLIGLLYIYDQVKYKNNLPIIPEHKHLLENAWLDLQNIASKLHPYCSRENDLVHDYLLERIKTITSDTQYSEISDDYENSVSSIFKQQDTFNATSTAGRVIYFESSNIVVRLKGTDPKLPELLLSAHYDAVPTSHGATDDGTGITSMLAILEHFSKNQPERGLVFNFNNNEEFGLLGSTIFMEHPWSKNIEYFINLEGTGAGGKAVLFRTSDTATAKIYKEAVVDSPFGNSIYQEGFYNRYIHSETDYKVYDANGLRGWDIAFYKPRDLYHTIRDSVGYTSKEALWHMLNTTLQLADYLISTDEKSLEKNYDSNPAIYFDISGLSFFTISSKDFFFWNCFFMIVMPLTNICLLYIIKQKNNQIMVPFSTWLKLPFSLVISGGVTYFISEIVQILNPYVISRNYILPILLLSSSFLLINYLVLTVLETLFPSFDLKTIAINEVSFILWLILFIQNFKSYHNQFKNTGIYPLTITYVLFSLTGNLGYVFMIFKKINTIEDESLTNNSYGAIQTNDVEAGGTADGDLVLEPDNSQNINIEINSRQRSNNEISSPSQQSTDENDERRPLIRTTPETAGTPSQNNSKIHYQIMNVFNYDWLLEFLILVPIPTYILFNGVVLIASAVNQTFQDTGDITSTYIFFFAGSTFMIFPMLPFLYKVNFKTSNIIFIFSVSIFLFTCFILSPFTESLPMKIRYIQVNNKVQLFGIRKDNLMMNMINDLPSVKSNNLSVQCVDDINLTQKCEYVSVFEPHLINNFDSKTMKMMDVEIIHNDKDSKNKSPYEPINAEIKIKVLENRMCNIYFHSTTKVRQVTVFKPANNINESRLGPSNDNTTIPYTFKTITGIDELQLHKLNFDQDYYHIGIQWLPHISLDSDIDEEDQDNSLILDVECFWGEYEDRSIDQDGTTHEKLPSLAEIMKFKPVDISITNKDKGLIKFTKQINL